MEASELQAFKSILLALGRGQATFPGRPDEIMIENSPDMIEQGQTANERELALQRLERNLRRDRDAPYSASKDRRGRKLFAMRCQNRRQALSSSTSAAAFVR